MKDVILLDGGLGTTLWSLSEDKSPSWKFNQDHPDVVTAAHRAFVDAGSQIITANTFTVNALSLKGCADQVETMTRQAVGLAKAAAAGTSTKVALDVGPFIELLEPYGDLTEEEAEAMFLQQMTAGVEAGADLIFMETFMELELMKIAVQVASGFDLPIFCSMSFLKVGKTIMGNSIADMVEALKPYPVTALGLNCSLEPKEAFPLIQEFRKHTDLPLIFKPNAGLPKVEDGVTVSGTEKETFVADLTPARQYAPIYLGGCCGTHPDYIQGLCQALQK